MAIHTRRDFLLAGAATGGGLAVVMMPAAAIAAETKQGGARNEGTTLEEEVSPVEDLMREHGALRRVLLIYGEGLRRLRANQELPPKTLADTAGIIRAFVEDYHEKLEEDFLFPRFRKTGKLVDLVDVLLEQHRAGRPLTDTVLRLSTDLSLKRADDRRTLADTLRSFIRMYGPHAAREDTVLFPALHDIVSVQEYDRLGEDFEKKEQQLFGAEGFEKVVDRIASIEKSLGIDDLGQFTPRE